MHTLTVTLADLEGVTHGTTAAHTSVKVSARYSREVILTDGTIIPPVIKNAAIPGDGVAAFEVFESDSADVDPDYRDFAIVVTATVNHGHAEGGTYRRTVQVTTAAPDPVPLGSLSSTQGVPAKWTSIEALMGELATTVATELNDTGSASHQAVVDASTTTVEGELADPNSPSRQAIAAAATGDITATFTTEINDVNSVAHAALVTEAGQITDPTIAGVVDNPVTDTRAALDDLTRPATGPNPLTGWFHAVDRLPGRVWSTTAATNSAAIQAAIDEAWAAGGGTVYLHANGGVAVPVDAGIQMRLRVIVHGQPWMVFDDRTHHLEADSPEPIFKCGVFTPASLAEQATEHSAQVDLYMHAGLVNVSARNNGGPVATIHHAQNFLIQNAQFSSINSATGSSTIIGRYCYRSKIIGQSVIKYWWVEGGPYPTETLTPSGFSVDLGADANGFVIDGLICGGSYFGGGIHVERSYNASIENVIIETSKWGVCLATSTDSDDGAGTVTAPALRNINTERTLHPMTLGTGSGAVRGGSWTASLLSVGGVPLDDATLWPNETNHPRSGMMHLGRIDGMDISGIDLQMAGETFPPVLITPWASGDSIENCRIWPLSVLGYGGTGRTFQIPDTVENPATRAIHGNNQIPDDVTGAVTGVRAETSATINVGAGMSSRAFIPAHVYGGRILAIDVIDAEGDLSGCELRLGDALSSYRIAQVTDLSTLTVDKGRASVPISGPYIWADEGADLYVIAGTGTGSFRVRVTWHGA